MKKTLLLSVGMLGCLVQIASAQSLVTTTNDFALFTGSLSSDYYSDASTVNGIGNAANAGGPGGIGSLQLTLPGGWGTISDGPGMAGNQAFLTAIDPGSSPGTLVAGSGNLYFDVYTANLTSWAQFGVLFNYNNNWTPFFSSTVTSFTAADGRTWSHVVVPYTVNAVAGLTYFGFSLMENSDGGTGGVGGVIGNVIYVDNIQVTAVPEPGTMALAAAGGAALLFWRRRGSR